MHHGLHLCKRVVILVSTPGDGRASFRIAGFGWRYNIIPKGFPVFPKVLAGVTAFLIP